MKHPSRFLPARARSASLGLCALALPWLAASSRAQVVFSQGFSDSNYSAFTAATGNQAGTNQFNDILSGTGNSFTVANGVLQFAKTGNASAAATRTTALPTAGKAASFQFDLAVSGNTVSSNTADLVFQVGSNFTDSTSAEPTAVYQNFSIDLQAGGQFQIAGFGPTFTGTKTITLELNHSGATVNFSAPDGTTLALANNNFALFVGSTNVLAAAGAGNQAAVGSFGSTGNANLDITQFKLRYQSTADNYTVTLDNFVVTVVPEPSTYALLGLGLAGLVAVVVHRRRLNG